MDAAFTIAPASHRPSLFAGFIAAIMPVFHALYDARWRAPWSDCCD